MLKLYKDCMVKWIYLYNLLDAAVSGGVDLV